jgi:hypothetical protein
MSYLRLPVYLDGTARLSHILWPIPTLPKRPLTLVPAGTSWRAPGALPGSGGCSLATLGDFGRLRALSDRPAERVVDVNLDSGFGPTDLPATEILATPSSTAAPSSLFC